MKAEYTHEAVSVLAKWFNGYFFPKRKMFAFFFLTRPFDSCYIACRRQQRVMDVTLSPFFLSLSISTSEYLFGCGLAL